MPQSVPAFVTEDGKTHTNYLVALKHELFLMLSKVSENEVGARKIVESITKDTITSVTDLLEKIEDELVEPTVFRVVTND